MDVERSLITAILEASDLKPIAEAAITADYFLDTKNRHVFITLLRHHAEYGQVPSLAALKMDHPDYKFLPANDSYAWLIAQIQQTHALGILGDALNDSVDSYDNRDVEGVKAVLHAALNQLVLDIPSSRDSNWPLTGDSRRQRYIVLAESDGGLLGIPTGFTLLDRATAGFQREQLNFFVGPPKSGKTTMMLLSALAVHQHGLRPLFFTFEMSDAEIAERLDAFRAHISFEALRTGTLTRQQYNSFDRTLRNLELMPDLWVSADPSGAANLTGLAAKIDNYKPDVVFIDGLYMLTDEQTGEQNTSQALTNITRGLKRMAQQKRLPLNASSQVLLWKMDKKRGVTTNSIGYSSSFAQDADNIFSIEGTEAEDVQKIKVVVSRNSPAREAFLRWDWDTGTFDELPFDPNDTTGEWDATTGI